MSFFNSIFGDNFGGDLLDGFIGTDYLKDYSHASKLMRPNGFGLAPNPKFLFHVYFELNVPSVNQDKGLVGALVKSIQLPSFDLETKEYIQYNRKRNIHSAIKYRPVTIKLHDDASDNVRSLWHNYYSYYFSDTDYQYDVPIEGSTNPGGSAAYDPRTIYNRDNNYPSWGMSTKHSVGNKKVPFFKSIKIYGMNRGKFISYTLINPVIDTWTHDTYDYSQGDGVMEHTVSIKYEAVKYGRGIVKAPGSNQGSDIPGFMDESRYDTSPSPLSKPGSTVSILGQAGLLDVGSGAIEDLSSGNILGAIKKGGTAFKTFKNSDASLGDILAGDLGGSGIFTGAVTNIGRQTGILYPKAGKQNSPTTGRLPVKPTPIIPQNRGR